MKQYQLLLKKILLENSSDNAVNFNRETRSGDTAAIFGEMLSFDLRKGFPAVTTKKLAFKAVVGELLWFLNGENTLKDLRKRTELPEDAWTIWTEDCRRYDPCGKDNLGSIYGVQWRGWFDCLDTHGRVKEVDQIKNLVENIKKDPMSRYHIVSAWNVAEVNDNYMALPPCHMHFQVFCTEDGYMDLMWYQRSVDAFLGLPFNIASYGILLTLLAVSSGYRPRFLKCSLCDIHIYADHFDQVLELLDREPMALPRLKLPKVQNKEDFFEYIKGTASDFELIDYVSHPPIKAPLLVERKDEEVVDKEVEEDYHETSPIIIN